MFKSLLDQGLAAWKDSTGAARAGLIILALILVGGIVGVGIWSAQPDYVVIRVDVDNAKIEKAMLALENQGIRFKINGNQILVDERQRALAGKALDKEGISKSGNEPEYRSPDMLGSKRQHLVVETYNKERQLEAAIRKLKGVDDVVVMLAIPQRSSFINRKANPRASVTLTLGNHGFNESSAETVARMVMNAVPRIQLSHISVVDTSGFTFDLDSGYHSLDKQSQYRKDQEMERVLKVEKLLGASLGYENVLVTVACQTSYENARQTAETWDKANAFKKRQTLKSDTTESNNANGAGPAGTAGNVGRGAGSSSRGGSNQKMEEIETESEIPKKVREETINKYTVDAIDVSVVINKTKAEESGDLATLKKEFEEVVKRAVGFKESRGDQLNIAFFELADTTPPEPAAAPIPWEQIHEIMRNISLGFAGVVALLLVMMTFKKITPDEKSTPSAALANRKAQLERIAEMVNQHPDVLSQVIAAWSKSDGLPEVPGEKEKRKAA